MYSGVCITLQVSLAVQILVSSENMKADPQYCIVYVVRKLCQVAKIAL